jgi:tetratricopeptide (TPR) repeat protein
MRFDEHGSARSRFEALLAGGHSTRVRSRAVAGLGQLAARAGRNAEAIGQFERAAAIDPSPADAATVEALGRAHAALGNEAHAISVFRSRYDQARSNDDTPEIGRFGVLLANAQIDALDCPGATTTLSFVIGAVPNADLATLARVHWSQARLGSLRGDTVAARRHAMSALALLESSDDRRLFAYAHHLLAFAELDAGNPEVALELVERGSEILGADATDYDDAAFEIERARAYVQLGRLEEAASIAMGAAARFSSLHPVDFGRTYTELASAFLAQGERERAGELYELAIELLEPRPTRFLAEAYARYGEYLELIGDTSGALTAYRSVAALATQPQTVSSRP